MATVFIGGAGPAPWHDLELEHPGAAAAAAIWARSKAMEGRKGHLQTEERAGAVARLDSYFGSAAADSQGID
jgi:hypothetical protein